MTDFWFERGLSRPASPIPLHDFVNQGQPADAAPPPQPPHCDLPDDYAARLRAVELAVQLTMSKFDGGQQRVMDRARAFHGFLMGRRPYELALTKEAYDAAFVALSDMGLNHDKGELAEAAVDAAWAVIIGEHNI